LNIEYKLKTINQVKMLHIISYIFKDYCTWPTT